MHKSFLCSLNMPNKREKSILYKGFLQGKKLNGCETVCLWSFNFPLNKETQFKGTSVLIHIHCTGTGDSCGSVRWADSHSVGVSVDTMQKTKLWWFIKCFLGRQVSLPSLPLLPLARQRSGGKRAWSGRRNCGSSGWSPKQRQKYYGLAQKPETKSKPPQVCLLSTLHAKGVRRSVVQPWFAGQKGHSMNKRFICLLEESYLKQKHHFAIETVSFPHSFAQVLVHTYVHSPLSWNITKKGWKKPQTAKQIPVQQSGKCLMLRGLSLRGKNGWDEQPSARHRQKILEKTISFNREPYNY